MPLSDGTSGYFGDIPYIGPVEVNMLYSIFLSSRVHKLNDGMMASCRSLPYFMEEDNSLAQRLIFLNKDIKRLTVFPAFKKLYSSGSIFHGDKTDFIKIVHGPSRKWSKEDWEEIDLDINGIDKVLMELTKYVIGSSNTLPKFLIMNCDLLISQESGGFLFSILMVGVASILHSFSLLKEFEDRLNKITLGVHILDTKYGRAAGDKIHLYLESHLRLTVSNAPKDDSVVDYQALMKTARVVETGNQEEWVEEIRSCVVDWFEELCDEYGEEVEGKPSVIAIIIPDCPEKAIVKSKILDSYTSYPIQIVEVNELTEEVFSLSASQPLIFICSSTWVCNQMVTVNESRVLSRFNFKGVVHCGFIENQQNIEEELASTFTGFFSDLIRGDHVVLVTERIRFFSSVGQRSSHVLALEDIYLPDSILLLFRRFLCKYSPDTCMPRLSIPENFFINKFALQKYQIAIKFLEMGGAIRILSESDEIELTSIGRFLSYQFRYHQDYRYNKRFSVLDAKTIMWGYILRQQEQSVIKILREYHSPSSWIKKDLVHFCEIHKIFFEGDDEFENPSLVRHLATYGLERPRNFNRLHYVLSLPSGRREKIRNHFIEMLPTVCRGWNSDGGPTEVGRGETYCYPSSSAFCEITENVSDTQEKPIQCPIEQSYPLLVVRCLLHISFHNNCVFLESSEGTRPIPIPSEILRSYTVKLLLSSQMEYNTGGWLDGVGHSLTLIPSNESLLDFMRYEGGRFTTIAISGRRSKKRARESSADNAKKNAKDLFTGTLPRSEQERKIITEFVVLAKAIGVEKAEQNFRGKRGFMFLDSANELYPYYLQLLEQSGR